MPVPTPYLPATPLPDEDWVRDDPALRRLLSKRLDPSVWKALEPRLHVLGRVAPHEVDPLARRADAHGPTLREDGVVALDESYHALQGIARKHEVFTLSWRSLGDVARAPRLAAFALGYIYAQAEAGYYCPACMTDGAAFVLARHASAEVRERYVPRLVQREPEGSYEGAMFLTEARGGSDVGGATETVARQAEDGSWRLSGDKWFCSNANAECILALARLPDAPGGTRGLGLFVIPAQLPDGAPNPGIRRVKLKEKLGVRSMATGEFELRDAHAELVAGAGAGFKAMAEMVNLSRLYNAVTSVSVARRALREGQKNGAWREAFGRKLQEQPLYQLAVASLAVDVRGALWLVMDAAETFDAAFENDGDERAYRLIRALTPLAKAETRKLAVRAASEGCELLGGNGYVEDWVTPRLLRDAQVLPIWEGTTNVQALDFLRACAKDGAARALVEDSRARLPEDSPLRAAWGSWARDMQAVDGMGALRMLTRAYHLRAATLLEEDARDGDEAAVAFAEGYRVKHVEKDDAAFERLVAKDQELLAQWPTRL